MPAPPRKRAPRALKAVPSEPERLPGMNVPQSINARKGSPLGKNKQHAIENATHNHGPLLAPGKYLAWLPKAEEVPPKPTAEPKMEWPGIGHFRNGHPEWLLHTTFDAEGAVISREWMVRWVPPDERRCIARSIGKKSEWMGNRCIAKTLRGMKVCLHHGGRLSTVKKAAQNTLALASLPAAERLIHIALKKRDVSDSDRIKAIIQILDRAGVEGKQTLEIEVKPWQEVLERVYSERTGAAISADEVEGEDYILDDEDEEEADNED